MIPTAYEFHWDLGHIVFLGIFYCVISVVTVALGTALYHWLKDLRDRRASGIAWKETFHDLPMERRHCRHEFRGTVPSRICDNDFDCASCRLHEAFMAAERGIDQEACGTPPLGIDLPEHHFFHRGHTWVKPRADGTVDIGLDDLMTRCIGRPDKVLLPESGSELEAGDRVATVARGPYETRILAPISGKVVAEGDLVDGWLCRVQPSDPELELKHLLHGREAEVWMLRELESLQRLVSSGAEEATTLADGGQPVPDMMQAYPDADWDRIWAHLSLEV